MSSTKPLERAPDILLRIRRLAGNSFCAFALAAAGLLAAASFARAEKWKDPTEAEKAIVEDASKGLVGAVYLDKQWRSENQMFRLTVRAKVLSKSGFDIGTVEGLAPNARSISGRTVSPAGKVTELSSKDVRTVTVVKAAGRSIEQQVFTMPALEPGCFIEYTYQEWGWLGSASDYHTEILFQDKYPVLHEELVTPKIFPFSSSVRKQKGVAIAFRQDGPGYSYSAADAAALHEEPYGLPRNEKSAAVIFAYVFPGIAGNSATFWDDATKKGLAPLLKQNLVKPSKVEKALKEIPGSRTADPKARLKAIYEYAQKTVKNRWALRAGETEPKGGWKHNDDASDTLSTKQGSPWDIASVCASLLKADGWKFRAVLTPDREERFFHPEIPSMFQFASGWVIEVRDPGLDGPVYLSFDHPLMRYGELPWTRSGTACYAIDIDAEAGERIEIPQLPPEKNARRRDWQVSLTEDGDVTVERVSRLDGAQAFEARLDLYAHGRDVEEKKLREHYQKLEPPGEIESVAWKNEETPDAEFVQTTAFRRKGIGGSLPGGRIELSPLTMIGESNPFTQEKREEPILFPFPYLDEDTVTVVPPSVYAPDTLPGPVEMRNQVGRYAIHIAPGDGNAIVVSRTLMLWRFSGSPEFYSEYRKLFESAARGDAGLSVVFKKAAAAKAKS